LRQAMALTYRFIGAAFLCLVASLGLQGCADQVQSRVTSFVEFACKVAVEKLVVAAEEHYVQVATQKCEELRDTAKEQLLNDKRADELHAACLNKLGLIMDDSSQTQDRNLTQTCAEVVLNQSGNALMHVQAYVQSFIEENNLTANLVDEKWLGLFSDEIAKLLPDEDTTANSSRLFEDVDEPIFNTLSNDHPEGAKGLVAPVLLCAALAGLLGFAVIRIRSEAFVGQEEEMAPLAPLHA